MALTLRYHGQTTVPVEVEGITPEALRELPTERIERQEIFLGNRKLPLAELFSVEGDPGDEVLHFEGDLSGVHWIGAHMRRGQVEVHGPAGRHVGSEMRGGEIVVEGNASDWVGGEMHGGLIRVRGNAGHLIGAAYRGSRRGMTGGTILIDGDIGNEIGHTMRRGWIAVGGSVGDMIAFNMIAGSIFIFGQCGIRPAAGMRRGTIAMFGNRPQLLPSFKHNCRLRPVFMRVMLRRLSQLGFSVDPELLTANFDHFGGDLVALGKGEILMRCD